MVLIITLLRGASQNHWKYGRGLPQRVLVPVFACAPIDQCNQHVSVGTTLQSCHCGCLQWPDCSADGTTRSEECQIER